MKEVTKLTAIANYQMIRQGGYESIIAFKENFNFTLKAYKDQGNKKLDDPDIAMDFFRGLDNTRYATFKTDYINGLTSKAIDPPKDLNKIYLLANQWLKPKATTSSFASTFSTTLDRVDEGDGRGRRKGKKQQGEKKRTDKNTDGTSNKGNRNKDKRRACFICDEEGHFANECPQRKQAAAVKQENDDERVAHITWEASTFMTFKQVNAIGYTGLSETKVLLDNQADISIIKPSLLCALVLAEKTVTVNGVGGLQLKVDCTGYLDDFFRVYASDETKANVLSFAEVEELYDITYVPREAFIVHLPEQDLEFRRKGKLYVADFAEQKPVYVTQVYTKAEEERAKRAYELVQNSGYPSYQEAIHLVEDGNIAQLPEITAEDVRRAYDLYGNPPEYVRGKMVKRKASWAVVDDDLIMDQKKQTLYSDIMHIDSVKILVTVCKPLQLTLQCKIERETQGILGPALQGQLELLRNRGFIPTMVYDGNSDRKEHAE